MVFAAARASGVDDHIVDLEQAEQVRKYARVSGMLTLMMFQVKNLPRI